MVEKINLSLSLAGVDKKDSVFLKTLINLFSDPDCAAIAEKIREGNFALQYNPVNGAAHVVDLREESHPPTESEIINFFAGFTTPEWEKVRPHRVELLTRFTSSRASGFKFAEEILGRKVHINTVIKEFAQG